MKVLGVDWSADMAGHFADELLKGTFTKRTNGDTYDASDPSGPPDVDEDTYGFSGHPFSYDVSLIDGERIIRGDYAVIILLGSINENDAVKASLDLDDVTDNIDTVIRARVAGASGDEIVVSLIGDASSSAGELEESDTEVALHFQDGGTTVAQLEALIATSTLIEVQTAGTPSNVLDAIADAVSAVALAGGTDGTPASAVPEVDDLISIAPPGATAAMEGRIIDVGSISQASVTVQVRGPGLG